MPYCSASMVLLKMALTDCYDFVLMKGDGQVRGALQDCSLEALGQVYAMLELPIVPRGQCIAGLPAQRTRTSPAQPSHQ